MKFKYLYILFVGLICSCSPDKELLRKIDYKIDKVVCQANSNYFVADGISEIGLEVKLYTIAGNYKDISGNTRTEYQEIPKSIWKDHDIKFFDKEGKQYTSKFTSTVVPPEGYIDFYAEVDGVKSSKPILQLLAEYPKKGAAIPVDNAPAFFRMNVRQADLKPVLKRFPVVFHIIDSERSKLEMQELKADAIQYTLNLYNNVFGRKVSVASNGANTNIEFVGALRDPKGKILMEPGINRVYLSDAELTEFKNAPNNYIFQKNRAACFWDFDKYLNIWVINAGGVQTTTVTDRYLKALPFIYSSNGYNAAALPLPNFLMNKVKEYDAAGLLEWAKMPPNLEAVGLVFIKNGFAKWDLPYIASMSAFLGIIPNCSANNTSIQYINTPNEWIDDFCEDTFIYNPFFGSETSGGIMAGNFGNAYTKYTAKLNSEKKTAIPGYPWLIYTSGNVGEEESFMSVVTQDQARRIDWTINHAVARQPWRNDYAIKPVN